MNLTASDLLLITIVIISFLIGIRVASKAKSRTGFIGWCLSWYVGACYLAGIEFIFIGNAPHGLPMNWIAFIVSPIMPFLFFKSLFTDTIMTTDIFLFYAIFPMIYISGLWWYASKEK